MLTYCQTSGEKVKNNPFEPKCLMSGPLSVASAWFLASGYLMKSSHFPSVAMVWGWPQRVTSGNSHLLVGHVIHMLSYMGCIFKMKKHSKGRVDLSPTNCFLPWRTHSGRMIGSCLIEWPSGQPFRCFHQLTQCYEGPFVSEFPSISPRCSSLV